MKALSEQTVLAFAPAKNVEGKKDATGAFQPEARAFLKLASPASELVLIDNELPLPARRAQVLAAFGSRAPGAFTSVAFLCHGWLDGIQLGFLRRHAGELASAVVTLCGGGKSTIVPLFCCSTGKDPHNHPLTAPGTGDGSFADRLRDALCAAGDAECRVMAHTTVAHTTKNPMVLFMDGMGIPEGGVGGYAPVSPKSKNWAAWKKSLREPKGTLRFRMSYMSPAEIHAELGG